MVNGDDHVCMVSCADLRTFTYAPRLFHLSSVSGVFEASEVINPAINHEGVPSPFPFLQSDLYNVTQPGRFFSFIPVLSLLVSLL